MATRWTLQPGNQILRTDLQAEFGGRTQGGIGPSRKSPNVFVFSDPVSGEKHGYVDGWRSDGCFHYTGEGQRGDQQMKSGNSSILNHKEHGDALRVFKGARGVVTYMGEFEVDPKLPFYTTDAPETGGGPLRSVIVFRLKPKGTEPQPSPNPGLPITVCQIREVPVEEHLTERYFVEPSREPTEAERRESPIVKEFRDYWLQAGYHACRNEIFPIGEAKPILTDLYVPAKKLLIEAKGTVERGAVRMALGQLLDYRRFVQPDRCAVLLPSRPREDLVDLIHSADVDLWFKAGKTFELLPAPQASSHVFPAKTLV